PTESPADSSDRLRTSLRRDAPTTFALLVGAETEMVCNFGSPERRRVQPDRDRSLGYAGNFGPDSAPPNTTKYRNPSYSLSPAATKLSSTERCATTYASSAGTKA